MAEINPNKPNTAHMGHTPKKADYTFELHGEISATKEATGEFATTAVRWFSASKSELKADRVTTSKGESAPKATGAFRGIFSNPNLKAQSKAWASRAG